MAKTAKLKSKPSSNPRSRASKRATSPSINLDKSLKASPAPRNNENTLSQQPTPSVLAPRSGAGITKKKKSNSSKRGNAKTRGQKIRQEKGLQRAEVVMDRWEKKVEGAREREGKRRERRKVWDEVNSGVGVDGVIKRGKETERREVDGVGVGTVEDWEDVRDDGDDDRDWNGDGDEEMVGVDGAAAEAEAEAHAESAIEDIVVPVQEPAVVLVETEKLVASDHVTSVNGIEEEEEIT